MKASLTKKNYSKLWFTIVYYSYYTSKYGTMELWFTMNNYSTMEKTMVLWTKLWYYTEHYGTSIYEEKNDGLPKT